MNKEGIVQEILNSAGVVIDDNWITYPTENSDGYDDPDWPILGFYASDEDQDPICEFSMNDLETAKIDRGVLFVNDNKIQLLQHKDFDYRVVQ